MSVSDKRCPIAGCPEPVPEAKLMCLTHWRAVPSFTQRCVTVAYSALRKQPSAANVQIYKQARQAAIDAATRVGPLSCA